MSINDQIADLKVAAAALKDDVSTLKSAMEAYIAKNPTADVADLQDALDSIKASDSVLKSVVTEIPADPPPVVLTPVEPAA